MAAILLSVDTKVNKQMQLAPNLQKLNLRIVAIMVEKNKRNVVAI